jgi:ubiquinone/menaquinone biosynthesis C-methylase UbiE
VEPEASAAFNRLASIAAGEKILDVGCGTGSLTFALLNAADLKEITAIDYPPVFVAETIRRSTDPRIKVALFVARVAGTALGGVVVGYIACWWDAIMYALPD